MTNEQTPNPLAAKAKASAEVSAQVAVSNPAAREKPLAQPLAPEPKESAQNAPVPEAKSPEQMCYILPAGSAAYVCQDGTRISANQSVITSWAPEHEKELDAGVRCGNFRKVRLADVHKNMERPVNTSIVAS